MLRCVVMNQTLSICDVPESRESVPPYLRIAGIIREQIERGELRPGEQVPSMARIAEQYGVSRGTARRVLIQLRDWGVVVITPGWGTFVKVPGDD